MKKVTLAILCLVLVVAAVGCGTIKGIGEDIGAVGGWITKGSDGVKENLK